MALGLSKFGIMVVMNDGIGRHHTAPCAHKITDSAFQHLVLAVGLMPALPTLQPSIQVLQGLQ
jgi:hypothetical protein